MQPEWQKTAKTAGVAVSDPSMGGMAVHGAEDPAQTLSHQAHSNLSEVFRRVHSLPVMIG